MIPTPPMPRSFLLRNLHPTGISPLVFFLPPTLNTTCRVLPSSPFPLPTPRLPPTTTPHSTSFGYFPSSLQTTQHNLTLTYLIGANYSSRPHHIPPATSPSLNLLCRIAPFQPSSRHITTHQHHITCLPPSTIEILEFESESESVCLLHIAPRIAPLTSISPSLHPFPFSPLRLRGLERFSPSFS